MLSGGEAARLCFQEASKQAWGAVFGVISFFSGKVPLRTIESFPHQEGI